MDHVVAMFSCFCDKSGCFFFYLLCYMGMILFFFVSACLALLYQNGNVLKIAVGKLVYHRNDFLEIRFM